jgi:hypothetical protein
MRAGAEGSNVCKLSHIALCLCLAEICLYNAIGSWVIGKVPSACKIGAFKAGRWKRDIIDPFSRANASHVFCQASGSLTKTCLIGQPICCNETPYYGHAEHIVGTTSCKIPPSSRRISLGQRQLSKT